MQIINQLKINVSDAINIVIPVSREKYNYFYKATEWLSRYDQISIEYQQGDNKIEIARNMLEVLYEEMCDVLKDVVEGQQALENQFDIGRVGYAYNMCINQEIADDDYFLSFPIALCGNKHAKAWMYTRDEVIYLEIAPLYPGLYKKEGINIAFEDFMQNYHPIGLYVIDKYQVKEWLNQCKMTLQKVE